MLAGMGHMAGADEPSTSSGNSETSSVPTTVGPAILTATGNSSAR
jgi:hypothetical protein